MRYVVVGRWLFSWLWLRWTWLFTPAQKISALLLKKFHSHSSIIIIEDATVVFSLFFVICELRFSFSLLCSGFVLSLKLPGFFSNILSYLLSQKESWVLLSIILVPSVAVFHQLLWNGRWEERSFIGLQRIGPWSLSNH